MGYKINYNQITETPGNKASKEELERALQRYKFAKSFVQNKSILEVACGTGIGLNYLADEALSVYGIDIDDINLKIAKTNLKNSENVKKINIENMDALNLEFSTNQFDVVIIFEAIYYLENIKTFISEVKKVLKKDGILIIGSVNKNWESFHPSPFSKQYYSIPDYKKILSSEFNKLEFYGGFLTKNDSKFYSGIKKIANNLNLIPESLKARALVKRIFMGKLSELPKHINDKMAEYQKPERINNISENKDYKIIYVIAQN